MRSLLLVAALTLVNCKTTSSADPGEDVVDQYTDDLQIDDLKPGQGDVAKLGMHLTVHYTGWLTNGEAFDTSIGKEPLTFELGARRVIKGWDRGLAGMKVGGKRKLIVPPQLAYGHQGSGTIPPDARLIFEVELLAVAP